MMVVLACTGCDVSDSTEPGAPPADPAPASSAAKAVTPQVIDQQVIWPARDSIDREALASLPEAAVAAVSTSALPVLVPARGDLLTHAVVMTQPRWTALSSRSNGLTVSLHASRAAHHYAHIAPLPGTRAMRGQHGFVGQNRGIWSASWRENGVAYALDIECASLPDPRCDDAAEVLALVEELVYVGGAGATEVQP